MSDSSINAQQHRAYIELYGKGQEMLDKHLLQVEDNRQFLQRERQKLDLLMKDQLALQRRCSNQTIKEETEQSQTLTQMTPKRDQSVSPHEPYLSKNSTTYIGLEQISGPQSLQDIKEENDDHTVEEDSYRIDSNDTN